MTNKFQLLKELSLRAQKNSEIPLDGLKKITKEYMDTYNELVESIWALQAEIERSEGSEKKQLTKQLSNVQTQLEECNSRIEIDLLLERIKAIEIKETGSSKIGSNSPYIL